MRYLLISILALCGICANAAVKHSDFARTSLLASGKWVKIGVDRNGIYEISYETLRNMGFSNPQRVGLYGRGGAMAPQNFVNSSGVPQFTDDLQPVAVFHHDNKLYFYGRGPQEFKLSINSSAYDAGGYYTRVSNNIYSSIGYYFLSDFRPPVQMEQVNSTGTASLTEYTMGVNYVSHEKDLFHNNSNTGQLYYGEKMTIGNERLTWDVPLPGAIPGATGSFECVIYTDKVQNTLVSYGFDGADDNTVIKVPWITSSDFVVHSPTVSAMKVPSDTPKAFTSIDFLGNNMEVSNLDYWTISYARTIPTLRMPDGSRMAQDFIAFPRLPRPKSGKIRIPDGINRIVFDITDPTNPKYIDLMIDGSDGIAKITALNAPPRLAIIDPLMPQLQITSIDGGASDVVNQDLHAQAVNGADLIIICIPQLRESAERLANLHRNLMGQRVIVATAEEVYNEFSSGVPDPMAYRALVKMAYTSPYGCKNLLLFGPLYADFRGISVEKNPDEGLIAIQSPTTSQVRGGFNCNDFYGAMIDYIGTKTLESLQIHVGVGILPARYPAEAATYVDKVTEFMKRTDFAYTLNRFLNIGGYGDADIHSKQVPDIEGIINSYSDRSIINTPLLVDAYGYKEGHDKLFNCIDEGVSVISYFGHGNPLILNHEGEFFRAPDVYLFRNRRLPFWGFAGCELSEPDKGVRGMGESVVLSTPYGMIGSLIATRETWSSQNLDFFKRFHANFLRDGGQLTSPKFRNAPTIGEVFARTKSSSSYTNELAYQLLCDPAIVIPTINRGIILDDGVQMPAIAGEYIELSGYVKSLDSDSPDTDFNGELVARVMEPLKVQACPHVIMKDDPRETIPTDPSSIPMVTYADTQMAMTSTDVINGRFTIKIMLPSAAADFDGQTGRLHLCAYDPDSRNGAGGMSGIDFIKNDGDSALDNDQNEPSIEIFQYVPELNALYVKVTDDTALAFDSDPLRPPFRMRIDSNEYRAGATTNPVIDAENNSYTKIIPLDNINEGSHTAWITVRDAAGNVAQAEIVFDYLPASSRYAIALRPTAVDGEGEIYAVGETPAEADIVILDRNGMLVRREAFVAGSYNWDARDNAGNAVAPGLYKAYIIETGDGSRKGHSATIDIPVI